MNRDQAVNRIAAFLARPGGKLSLTAGIYLLATAAMWVGWEWESIAPYLVFLFAVGCVAYYGGFWHGLAGVALATGLVATQSARFGEGTAGLIVATFLSTLAVAVVISKWGANYKISKGAQRYSDTNQTILNTVIESCPGFIYVKDSQGRFLLANHYVTDFFELPLDQVLGRSHLEIQPGEAAESIAENDRFVMESNGHQILEEAVPKNGETRYYLSTKIAVPAACQGDRILVGVTTDITERKRQELQLAEQAETERRLRADLEDAIASREEMIASLSHELRTPLTALLGWSRLIEQSSNADPKEYAALVARNADELSEIVTTLTDVNRLTTGRLKLSRSTIELDELLKEVAASLADAADAKEIGLELALKPIKLPGDADRLQTLFANVLGNAVKFTPKQGRISVELEEEDGQVVARIRDNGRGIDPEFLPKMFELFSRQNSETRNGDRGLGLVVAKRIAELHGGTIHIESAGEGKGTEATIRLPGSRTISTELAPE